MQALQSLPWEGMSLCLGMANHYLPKLFDELQKYVIVHAHNKTAIMVAELATPIAFHWNELIYARGAGMHILMLGFSTPMLGHRSQDLSHLY